MIVCQHSETGFCYDELTAAQAAEFDALFRHAYHWAISVGRDRNEAEAYAMHCAVTYWDNQESLNHNHVHRNWKA